MGEFCIGIVNHDCSFLDVRQGAWFMSCQAINLGEDPFVSAPSFQRSIGRGRGCGKPLSQVDISPIFHAHVIWVVFVYAIFIAHKLIQ